MLSSNVRPVLGGLQRAYVEAIKSSVSRFASGKKMIGYVHLWTGTHEETSVELQKAVHSLRDCDAIILDLRNGYGGAWWDHLDPFYKNTSSYFKATWIERNGKKSDTFSERKKNRDSYNRPMAVLINEGVRSGKEALAFQFKKTKRALLIGTKTAGFFVAGGAYFRETELPYFLYLSSKGLLLDGVNLEGHGIEPDISVPFSTDQSLESDPQLEKAKEVLKRKIKGQEII